VDGESAGVSTVESSSAATHGPSAGERFIITPRLCTEIIEDSLPRVADSERAGSRVADMRVHLEATRELPAASPAAIAGQP
jgi:hypothetical protein